MTKGNQVGTEQFLISVPLPQETDTYTVISHQEIIEKVENELNNASLEIIKVDYTYSFGGEVALARVYIKSVVDADMGMLFTWQNSYNKKVKFSCAIGAYIHDNNASLIGTEGLSWIRKHTGTANSEAFEVIESLIDLADTHFTKIIAEKERMKAMELDTESYAHVMGALYFEHSLVTSTQASAVKQEREKPVHTYSDKDTLWGLYKLLMYGIENMDITRWQASQQKLHHLIMAEYAISQERMDHLQTCALSADIHAKDMIDERTPIGPGITPMGPRVVVEEDENGNPLVSGQAVMVDYSKDTEDDGVNQAEFDAHVESDEEDDEVIDTTLIPIPAHHEPLVPTQEELDAEHVGPPEMYTGDAVSTEHDMLSKVQEEVEEVLEPGGLFDTVEEEEVVEVDEDNLVEDPVALAKEVTTEEEVVEEPVDYVALANKYSVSEEEIRVEMVDPKSQEQLAEEYNATHDDSHIEVETLTKEEALDKYGELLTDENRESILDTASKINDPVKIIPPTINLPKKEEVVRSEKPVTIEEADEEEDFLNITEHDGLTVPEGMIENAAIAEKKMIILYGSVRPYDMEVCGDQLNVVLEDTFESFYVPL